MSGSSPPAILRGRLPLVLALLYLLASSVVAGASAQAAADGKIEKIRSSVVGSDGKAYSVTNHLTEAARAPTSGDRPRQWLLVWAGDDKASAEGADPDFMAVVDATRGTPDYGKVVNTVTLDGKTGNEPHHMQYVWHKGDKVFAGGIFSDTTYVFDVARLPEITLSGITLPADTPCGTAPDAYSVLGDGTAYASFMGGPDVAGPCTYSNGETRVGNGAAGSPGELVHLDQNGKVLSEAPAALKASEGAEHCPNKPALSVPTCANPHGISMREDLGVAVTSDFAEPRVLLTPNPPDAQANAARDTLRVFDISNRNDPRLKSVSRMPDGPRQIPPPAGVFGAEPRGVMENAITHKPGHRGAFAATMQGGAVFYTPDITAARPKWREVFDDQTAFKRLFPTDTPTSALDGGAWLQVSPDDRFLYHVVLTAGLLTSPPAHKDAAMAYVLDIHKLLASNDPRCNIDTLNEVSAGGDERDCPALVGAVPFEDKTNGGPHWAAMDNFRLDQGGKYRETTQIDRIAVAKYMLAASALDGDHKVCMVDVGKRGDMSLDETFRDEKNGTACVDFNRAQWPHGNGGNARPHGVLFTVNHNDVR